MVFLEMLGAMLCALSSGVEHGNKRGGEGQIHFLKKKYGPASETLVQ